MTVTDRKKYFYDGFAEQFDSEMNKYDLNKRLSIIFKELLRPDELAGKKLLDIGCGTGWFSQRAMQSGADVVSADIGLSLLKMSSKKSDSKKMVSDVLSLGIKDMTFDYILATEVIEHTRDPRAALAEIHRVLKNDGTLLMTVPNRIWHFTVHIADVLKIRKYDGYENWVGYYQLRKWFKELGFDVEEIFGFHLFPFVFAFSYPLLDRLDRYSRLYSPIMLNIAARCRKIN